MPASNVRFPPIADTVSGGHNNKMMWSSAFSWIRDPFAADARRERLRFELLMLALILPLFALSILLRPGAGAGGEALEAEVVRFGTRATELGNRPVVTVRLDDGSMRAVRATRGSIAGCKAGDRISLIQRRRFLGVGIKGCYIKDRN